MSKTCNIFCTMCLYCRWDKQFGIKMVARADKAFCCSETARCETKIPVQSSTCWPRVQARVGFGCRFSQPEEFSSESNRSGDPKTLLRLSLPQKKRSQSGSSRGSGSLRNRFFAGIYTPAFTTKPGHHGPVRAENVFIKFKMHYQNTF